MGDKCPSPNGTTDEDDKIGYRYVMPQIGFWTRTADTGDKCSETDGSPNFSNVSLDRSRGDDLNSANHLVSGEYRRSAFETNGRAAIWPIAGAFRDGELVMDTDYRWHADAAYRLPDDKPRIQGVTRFEGRWYLSQSHGKEEAGKLHVTEKMTTGTGNLRAASASGWASARKTSRTGRTANRAPPTWASCGR